MRTFDRQIVKRLVLALIVAMLVTCSWLSPLEPSANNTVDAGLKRALISFATARALNSIISVAQGTEIAVEPAGIGVVLSLGQVLDPVNDLVEQFSNLMLTASVAFGVEKVLINMGAHWVISLTLTLSALSWVAFYLGQRDCPAWLSRLLVILLMTRFALPVVVIGSDFLFQQFMEADYQSSQQGIERVSVLLEKSDPSAPIVATDSSLLERVKGWATQHTDLKAKYDKLKQAAEQITERIIKLVVVFLLQTLVLPIFLLWILWGVIRKIFEFPPVSYR